MSDSFNDLKENLLRIMCEKDYTQFEMAIQCDISMSELQKIIARNRKHKGICFSRLDRISENLGIPASDLINKKDGMA